MAGLHGLLKIILMALAGIGLGLSATVLLLDARSGLGSVRAGIWQIWPKAGTLEIDPYTRARFARTGEIPLGLAEGLSLTATADSNGEALHSQCSYIFAGHIPPARYWTLTIANSQGGLAGARNNLTSSEILRRADGYFDVQIARNARPGNWLPVNLDGDFMLVMRLYDTAVSASASAMDAGALPDVKKAACL